MIQSDITIVGAGPGGASAALGLAQRNIPALLIDRTAFPRDKICGDALSGKVVLTLKRLQLNLPDELSKEQFVLPSHGVTFVAPNGKSIQVPFAPSGETQLPPGFIASRMDFDHWLFQKAKQAKGISVETGLHIESYERTKSGWLLRDEKGVPRVETSMLIAADGAHSRFARKHGGMEQKPEFHCAGLRQYYRGVSGLSEKGFIELHFLDSVLPGYFWIFPMANGRANVGLGVRSDIVAKKKLNLKHMLADIIQHHPSIAPRFKDAEAEEPIRGYGLPLGSVKHKLSGDNYLLLGDAASLIDPFTGEGIGNAMISGLKAAETIAAAYPGFNFSAQTLSAYDESVYKRLWPELNLSRKMQHLVRFPWLFNLVVNKANRSKTLQDTLSCMFNDIELRERLKNPLFYLKVLVE